MSATEPTRGLARRGQELLRSPAGVFAPSGYSCEGGVSLHPDETEAREARLRGLDDVLARARARKLHCAREGSRVVVSGSIGGSPSVAAITWNAPQGVVLFTCAAPVKVSPSNRDALIAAAAEINAELAVLGLVVRERGVYFTAHAYIETDGAISAHIFERSLDLVFEGITQHRARLKRAAKGSAE